MKRVSPEITRIEWGAIEVADLGTFKDAKLWPGGGREWDWGETGTRHVPGIQPSDVDELLGHDPEVIVLTRGVHLRLQACPETLELLAARGVEVVREETGAAVAIYNQRSAAGERVAGLFHSTC